MLGKPCAHLIAQVRVLVQDEVALLLHARVLGPHGQYAATDHGQLVLARLHLLRQLCSTGGPPFSDALPCQTLGVTAVLDCPRGHLILLMCVNWCVDAS